MIEVKVEVKAFRVTALCSKCEKGSLEFNGASQAKIPALYHHTCTNKKCGHLEWLQTRYPTIRYEEVTE
jgi:hypothetical protein